jgi:hypothetical protein
VSVHHLFHHIGVWEILYFCFSKHKSQGEPYVLMIHCMTCFQLMTCYSAFLVVHFLLHFVYNLCFSLQLVIWLMIWDWNSCSSECAALLAGRYCGKTQTGNDPTAKWWRQENPTTWIITQNVETIYLEKHICLKKRSGAKSVAYYNFIQTWGLTFTLQYIWLWIKLSSCRSHFR